MKRFIAQLSGGDFINIPADEMRLENDAIIVAMNGSMVAYIDVGVCLCAHLSDKDVAKCTN